MSTSTKNKNKLQKIKTAFDRFKKRDQEIRQNIVKLRQKLQKRTDELKMKKIKEDISKRT